jgi:hypothetical protein
MVARLRAHVQGLWPGWTFLLPLPLLAWPIFRLERGEIRWEYIAFLVVPLALAYATARSRKLFLGLYPLALVGVMYDAMRYVEDVGVTAARVHLCDLRAAEMRWFGINVGGVPMTLHDWLQPHAAPALDVFFAIPYGTFLFAYIGFAVFLWTRDFRALERFTWAFFALNLAGFLTYHLYPAAPPWYFHAHGCTVDLTAHATEGPNLARVDRWLGFRYFHGMYGRASDVFGAMPSLHCAYPLVIVLEGWRHMRTLGRALAVGFCVSMWCAAVYLDHHWVLDVVAGAAYAIATVALLRWLFSVRDAADARVAHTG